MKKIGFELKDEIEVDESQELTLGEVESYMAESQDAFETVGEHLRDLQGQIGVLNRELDKSKNMLILGLLATAFCLGKIGGNK